MTRGWHREAGGAVLHPMPVLGIAVLLFNDHWLKQAWPGVISGKLSDIAGLVFFPLLLVAFVEVAQSMLARYRGPSDRLLIVVLASTALVFAATEVSAPANEVYRVTLAALQHPGESLALTTACRGVRCRGSSPRVTPGTCLR